MNAMIANILILLFGSMTIVGSGYVDNRAQKIKTERVERQLSMYTDQMNNRLNLAYDNLKYHIQAQSIMESEIRSLSDDLAQVEHKMRGYKRLLQHRQKVIPVMEDSIMATGRGVFDTTKHDLIIPISNKDSIGHPIKRQLVYPVPAIGKHTIHER